MGKSDTLHELGLASNVAATTSVFPTATTSLCAVYPVCHEHIWTAPLMQQLTTYDCAVDVNDITGNAFADISGHLPDFEGLPGTPCIRTS